MAIAGESLVPHYHRIKLALMEEIERGAYRPDHPFITEREICSRFGVSRATAVRALGELVHDGVLIRRRGVGTFVALTTAEETPARSGQPRDTTESLLIGCIVPILTSLHVMTVIRGIEHACNQAHYRLLLFESRMSPEVELLNIRRAREAGAQGLIVYPVEGSANVAAFETLQRDGIPFTLVDRYFPALPCDVVMPNNLAIGYQLTDYLVRAGHRHIALVWSEVACTSAHDRLTGYRMALQEHGIPSDPSLAALRPYAMASEVERRAWLQAWLDAPHRPTAYLAVNAEALARVANDLLDRGVRIPGEVALATMDTAGVDPILSVAAASAVLPSYDMGQEAVRLLRERLEQDPARPPQHIVLPAGIQTHAAGNGDPAPTRSLTPVQSGELGGRAS